MLANPEARAQVHDDQGYVILITAKFPEKVSLRKVSAANTQWTYTAQNASCPDCGSTEFEMRTYGGPMEYADTHCAKCGRLIRRFDAA
jgi:tRNA(Ile2) C34 agmatinyltransferase TiaS